MQLPHCRLDLSSVSLPALTTWTRLQALAWIPILLATWLEQEGFEYWRILSASLVLASVASLAWVLRIGRRAPDMVTLLRAFALIPLVAVSFTSAWTMWLLVLCVVLLDLLDGALARRLGATAEGAVLDMESDQLTVTILALLVVSAGGGAHVLLLPMMRHGFVIFAWWQGLPATDPKPIEGNNQRGRVVCALVITSLLLALLPGVFDWLRDIVIGIAVLALGWSFASDGQHLRQRRRAARELHGSS